MDTLLGYGDGQLLAVDPSTVRGEWTLSNCTISLYPLCSPQAELRRLVALDYNERHVWHFHSHPRRGIPDRSVPHALTWHKILWPLEAAQMCATASKRR